MSDSKSNKSFKQTHPFEKRKEESEKILKKYENRIPIIVHKQANSNIANCDKQKFLVPDDLSIAQFTFVIRKRIKLSAEQAIWIFVETKSEKNSKKNDYLLPPTSHTIGQIYSQYKDEDGFLYLTYSGENTFGSI